MDRLNFDSNGFTKTGLIKYAELREQGFSKEQAETQLITADKLKLLNGNG